MKKSKVLKITTLEEKIMTNTGITIKHKVRFVPNSSKVSKVEILVDSKKFNDNAAYGMKYADVKRGVHVQSLYRPENRISINEWFEKFTTDGRTRE